MSRKYLFYIELGYAVGDATCSVPTFLLAAINGKPGKGEICQGRVFNPVVYHSRRDAP